FSSPGSLRLSAAADRSARRAEVAAVLLDDGVAPALVAASAAVGFDFHRADRAERHDVVVLLLVAFDLDGTRRLDRITLLVQDAEHREAMDQQPCDVRNS